MKKQGMYDRSVSLGTTYVGYKMASKTGGHVGSSIFGGMPRVYGNQNMYYGNYRYYYLGSYNRECDIFYDKTYEQEVRRCDDWGSSNSSIWNWTFMGMGIITWIIISLCCCGCCWCCWPSKDDDDDAPPDPNHATTAVPSIGVDPSKEDSALLEAQNKFAVAAPVNPYPTSSSPIVTTDAVQPSFTPLSIADTKTLFAAPTNTSPTAPTINADQNFTNFGGYPTSTTPVTRLGGYPITSPSSNCEPPPPDAAPPGYDSSPQNQKIPLAGN